MAKIFEWFLNSCLKANAKKFHLLLSPFVDKAIKIENFTIKSSYAEILLGVTIDSNSSFSEHVTYHVQLLIANYMLCHVFPNI